MNIYIDWNWVDNEFYRLLRSSIYKKYLDTTIYRIEKFSSFEIEVDNVYSRLHPDAVSSYVHLLRIYDGLELTYSNPCITIKKLLHQESDPDPQDMLNIIKDL